MEDADAEVVWLFAESGRFRQGFNGPERLAWGDLDAWARVAGLDISPADADLIVEMSAAWCHGFRAETAPHDPWGCKIALASGEFASALTG